MSSPSRIRPYIYSLLVTALIFAIAEIALRAHWKGPDKKVLTTSLQTLWQPPPGQTLEWGNAKYHINSFGYRGPEFAIPKPPNTIRLYLSGDSSVFGDGIDFEKTFGAVLVDMLQPHLPASYTLELINGAVPGFSSLQSLKRLESGGWETEPNILIIANFWSDAARFAFPDNDSLQEREHNRIIQAKLKCDQFLSHSVVYQFSKDAVLKKKHIGRVDSQGVSLDCPRRVPHEQYEQNLLNMITKAKNRKISPILLLLPHPTDQKLQDNEELRAVRSDIAALGHTEIEQEYRLIMRRVAINSHTPLVDASRLLETLKESLFLDSVHPNKAGHALIAAALADTTQKTLQIYLNKHETVR